MANLPWISVGDMLPKKLDHVLVWLAKDGYAWPDFGYRDENGAWYGLDCHPMRGIRVTHWCRVSEPHGLVTPGLVSEGDKLMKEKSR